MPIRGAVPGIEVAQVHAVEGQPPGGRVEEAWNQVDQGGLAPAGTSHQGHGLAGADDQVDAPEDIPFAVIETDILEVEAPGCARTRSGAGRSTMVGWGSIRRDIRSKPRPHLQVRIGAREHADGIVELVVGQKRDEEAAPVMAPDLTLKVPYRARHASMIPPTVSMTGLEEALDAV